MITTMLTLAPLVALVVSLSPSLLSVLYGRSTTSKMNRHPIWCPFYARRGNSLRAFFFKLKVRAHRISFVLSISLPWR
ncbi:hypothetical protein CGJ12_13000 [Vibrio parahaemolyticus]|nr:hypothetical protein [Vibrio parahaemolyticus]EGR2359204.1 hypothetical protein [Vibrio parahaemolyticus]EGR3422505.1 hypothetical protein [Vibrio parahaemolyticus]NCM86662.1 hypothetical protein [Vibrio parahaemolyticus]NCN90957.1 hypothetical protein [Vibrio parahaemolyticus]